MRKSDYKKVNGKSKYIQDRLCHKGIFCISIGWIKWSKRYMVRSQRRKSRQEDYEDE